MKIGSCAQSRAQACARGSLGPAPAFSTEATTTPCAAPRRSSRTRRGIRAERNCTLNRAYVLAGGEEEPTPDTASHVGLLIRQRRRELRRLQRQVAEIIGTKACTIINWERGRRSPDVRFYPTIIRFLGNNPLPKPSTFAERLIYSRRSLGLSRAECTRRTGINESSLAGWESGRTIPLPRSVARLQEFFGWEK